MANSNCRVGVEPRSFVYSQFHKYYTDASNSHIYETSKDLSAIIYDCKAFYPKDHKKLPEKQRKFRFNYIENAPKLKELSEIYHKTHHFGIYFLLNERQSLKLTDQIFFVYPTLKTQLSLANDDSPKHIYGDHITFQYNPSVKLSVQIHGTQYFPHNNEYGSGDTIHNHLNTMDNIPMPTKTIYPKTLERINPITYNESITVWRCKENL
jgi:hypothetical protein